MKKISLTNRQQLTAGVLLGVGLLICLGLWLARVSFQKDSSMIRHKGATFSLEIPRESVVDEQSRGKMTFTATALDKSAETANIEDSLSKLTVGLNGSVWCSGRSLQTDALVKMDTDTEKGPVKMNGQPMTNYTKKSINGKSARVFEYRNKIHVVLSAAVQSDTQICLLSFYIPLRDEKAVRASAEQSLESFEMN